MNFNLKKNDFLIDKDSGIIFETLEVKGKLISLAFIGNNSVSIIEKKNIGNFYIISPSVKAWDDINSKKNKLFNKPGHCLKFQDNKVKIISITDDQKEMWESFDKNMADFIKDKMMNSTKTKRRSQRERFDPTDEDLERVLKGNDQEEIPFLIVEPSENETFENIILHSETLEQIEQEMFKLELTDYFDEMKSKMKSFKHHSSINFYGEPGTGKTISVKAIAHQLNKKILHVNYSDLISKFVGDTGKNISKYFKKATDDDMILFFDEADTLLQKRGSSDSNSHSNTQNQNIFMQEMDRFNGILILTTNFFENYDKALLRRFTNIKFELPDTAMRMNILNNHMPENVKLSKDITIEELAVDTEGFSGGDLKNIIEKVLLNFATKIRKKNMDKSVEEVKNYLRSVSIPRASFLEEVDRMRRAKQEYSNTCETSKKKIALV